MILMKQSFCHRKLLSWMQNQGRVKAIVPIDLPYPRRRTGKSFQEFRTMILNHLDHKVEEVDDWSI